MSAQSALGTRCERGLGWAFSVRSHRLLVCDCSLKTKLELRHWHLALLPVLASPTLPSQAAGCMAAHGHRAPAASSINSCWLACWGAGHAAGAQR